MSASYLCDGCGASVAAPKRVGHMLVRDYCDKCEVRALAFLDDEEALRERLAEKFNADRDALVAKASEGGFKLPDVPSAG